MCADRTPVGFLSLPRQPGRQSLVLPDHVEVESHRRGSLVELFGVTQRGHAVAIVTWRVGGQDSNYDVDPTVVSLQTANHFFAKV